MNTRGGAAPTLAWGILGTGSIAGTFARGVATSRTGRVVAVGSRSAASAERFGDEYDVPRRHASYDAMLADPAVQAVYVSTPHRQHAEWAIRAAEAGKHVLCEKPLAVNATEAASIVDAARQAGVFLMEAFMYRCHPQTHRLVELLRQRAVGDVRLIEAAFSFQMPGAYDPTSRLLDPALAGGGILDVGCYPVSMARLVAGVAGGLNFAEPVDVSGAAHLGKTGVDEWAVASLKFPGGLLAQLACGVRLEQEQIVRIHGSDGRIVIPDPWSPAQVGEVARILVYRGHDATPEDVVIEEGTTPEARWRLYALEADEVAEFVAEGRVEARPPSMTWADTLGNMRTLDRWREAVGLRYDFEGAGG